MRGLAALLVFTVILSGCGYQIVKESAPAKPTERSLKSQLKDFEPTRCDEAVSAHDTATHIVESLSMSFDAVYNQPNWGIGDSFDRLRAGTASAADRSAIRDYYKVYQIISDNDECFSPTQVAKARQILRK